MEASLTLSVGRELLDRASHGNISDGIRAERQSKVPIVLEGQDVRMQQRSPNAAHL